jgi:hypothetical protein
MNPKQDYKLQALIASIVVALVWIGIYSLLH